MREAVLDEFITTEGKLIEVFSSFSQKEVNMVPFSGSWTAGQVMQHINLSASSAEVLQGPVKKSNREPDEHISKLRSVFMDFSTKMNSPPFIIPEDKFYESDGLLSTFKDIAAGIKEIIQTSDLGVICLNAPPVLGELTRLELIRFISFHTQRHTHQLENIKRRLDTAKN